VEETNNATERVIGWSIKERYRASLPAWLSERPGGRDMSRLFVSQKPGKKPGTSASPPLLPHINNRHEKTRPQQRFTAGAPGAPGRCLQSCRRPRATARARMGSTILLKPAAKGSIMW
jgi:hypothetical protein